MSELYIYLPFALFGIAMMASLSLIILRMGQAMADCPVSGRAAKAGASVVVTGFLALGIGGLALIAAILPYLAERGDTAVLIGIGVAAIGLGIGFTQAAAVMQQIVKRAQLQAVAGQEEKPSKA